MTKKVRKSKIVKPSTKTRASSLILKILQKFDEIDNEARKTNGKKLGRRR
jgi:hypothetical protein